MTKTGSDLAEPRSPGSSNFLLSLGLLGITLFGCGYSQGSLFSESMHLVSVPIFENDSYYRELEFALTDEVIRQIQERLDVRIVPMERADIIVEGRILSLRQSPLSEDERDRLRESAATTTVRIRLRERSSGRLIKEYLVKDRADFIIARGETLLTAQGESFVDLARRIVYGMETDF